jgi:hypothetical protein
MRDSSITPEWRMKAARAALPYVHSKPSHSPEPAASAKQVEELTEEDVPLAYAFMALERGES